MNDDFSLGKTRFTTMIAPKEAFLFPLLFQLVEDFTFRRSFRGAGAPGKEFAWENASGSVIGIHSPESASD